MACPVMQQKVFTIQNELLKFTPNKNLTVGHLKIANSRENIRIQMLDVLKELTQGKTLGFNLNILQ